MKFVKATILFCAMFISACGQLQPPNTQALNDEATENEDLLAEHAETAVREAAVALDSVEAGTGFQDLAAFGDMVGDADIVALGEPTHGNREVFQLKHRMLEYLVHEKGFNLFGIEAPFAESEDLNDYVLHGRGSAAEALASITMWAWDTEEVVAMLDWMRQYNADPANQTKLKVFGFDIQNPERAVRLTLSYLDKVDPSFARDIRQAMGSLTTPFSDPDEIGWRPITPEEMDTASLIRVRKLTQRLDEFKAKYIAKAGTSEWGRARQFAEQVLWWVEANYNDGENYNSVRDYGMFEIIKWNINRNGDGVKAVLWAHNSHLTNDTIDRWGDMDTAGRHLRRHYGTEVRLVGFLFDHGEFTALDAAPGGLLRTFEVGPTKPGYFESVMVGANQDVSLLDLNEISDSGPVQRYFSTRRNTRHSGGGYSPEKAERYYADYLLPDAFDILAFVKKTTPTRTINRRDYKPIPILAQPQDLDFENGDAGTLSSSWVSWSKMQRWGYINSVTETTAASGQKSAQLCRKPGHMSPDVSGSLVQQVDALPYRGKRIALLAKAKTDSQKSETTAFVRLKIKPDPKSDVHVIDAGIYDSLDKYRVNAADWTSYTVEAVVPENAGSIVFGVFQVGEGCTWLDDVEIKIVGE
jgi:erythromycin esterase